MEMTLKELLEKKLQLDTELNKLIHNFEEETGIQVDKVSYQLDLQTNTKTYKTNIVL